MEQSLVSPRLGPTSSPAVVCHGRSSVSPSPEGGTLLISDPLGASLAAPAVWLLGPYVAFTLLVLFQFTFSAWSCTGSPRPFCGGAGVQAVLAQDHS